MMKSDSIAALAAALALAQGELENATTNAANDHFRSRYADLGEILNTVRPVLSKHGLSFVQLPDEMTADSPMVGLTTVLMHKGGEWISCHSACPIVKRDPQGYGSAITYLRRYSLAAICGVAQEDDDGNDQAAPDTAPDKKPAAKAKPKATISEEAVEMLKVKLEAAGLTEDQFCATCRITAIDQLEESRLKGAIGWIEKNAKPTAGESE